jgi:hypothetical protein
MTQDAIIIRNYFLTGEGSEAAAAALAREKRRHRAEKLAGTATRRLKIPRARRTV